MSSSSSQETWIDDERFDGMFINVAGQVRGIEPLLDTLFSFLRRKTDFFQGPSITDESKPGYQFAIETVNRVVQKHANIYIKQQQEKDKKKKSSTTIKKQVTQIASIKTKTATATSATSNDKKNDVPKDSEQEVIEMTDGGVFDISSAGPTESSSQTEMDTTTPSSSSDTTTKITTTRDDDDQKMTDVAAPAAVVDDNDTTMNDPNEKKEPTVTGAGPAPIGNGGTIPGKYTWTQTLSEVIVTIPVPLPTRGRDLNIKITKTHLKIQLLHTSTKEIIIDNNLCKSIICDDTFWTVEDQDHIVLTITKLNQMEWWECVCIGDPIINVRDIQPENSSLNDLDGDTRQTVEKMMYDQRQKALGLPSSDEQSKLSMLDKFKLQHPELDFSNAKIS